MMQVHIHMSKADTYETLGTFCLKENKVMCFKEVFGKEIVQSSIICKRRKPMLMMQNHTLKTLCIVRTLLTILNEYILYTLWDIESLKWRQFYLPNKSQKVNNNHTVPNFQIFVQEFLEDFFAKVDILTKNLDFGIVWKRDAKKVNNSALQRYPNMSDGKMPLTNWNWKENECWEALEYS